MKYYNFRHFTMFATNCVANLAEAVKNNTKSSELDAKKRCIIGLEKVKIEKEKSKVIVFTQKELDYELNHNLTLQ